VAADVEAAADNQEEFADNLEADKQVEAVDNQVDRAVVVESAVPTAPCRLSTRTSLVIGSTVANNRRWPSGCMDSIRMCDARLVLATTVRPATNAQRGCAYRANSNRSGCRNRTTGSTVRRPKRTYEARSFGMAIELALFAIRTSADSGTRNRPIELFDRLVEDLGIRLQRCIGDPSKRPKRTVSSVVEIRNTDPGKY